MADSSNAARKNLQIPNDLLNDLSSRFIINVPEEERVDLTRLCFQIELAHWFYLDFYCEENPKLPKCNVKDFIRIIFGHIPFLKKYIPEVDNVINEWRDYKRAVPTCGAILLDGTLKNVLLVQSFYSKTSWGFPKGKINIDELPHMCAIREVLEETGFDISDLINKDEFLEHDFNDQLIRLYIITRIPKDTKFQPMTRNEIKSVQWFQVNQLPVGRKEQVPKPILPYNNFFMVIPFVKPLKKWISTKSSRSTPVKGSHATQEKKIVDKQVLKQQELFAEFTKNDLAKLIETTDEQKTSRNSRSNYSPPPRMVRQRNQKQSLESDKRKNKNKSPFEEKIILNSKYYKKEGVLAKQERGSNTNKPSKRNNPFYSETWENVSLDCDAIVATFNINLRRMPGKLL